MEDEMIHVVVTVIVGVAAVVLKRRDIRKNSGSLIV